MSITEYNGGAVVAMTGKECVAIGSDLRLGAQLMTVATDYKKVYKIHDHLYVGIAGLGTDAQTLHRLLKFKHNLYKLEEERDIHPTTFARFLSSTLYERRFGPYYVSPVIAGLEPDGKPFICHMDVIGATTNNGMFSVAGTMPEALMGMCESVWRPDMGPEELFEATAQSLLSGVDRDSLSGWGAIVHVVTKDEVITRTLKGRMD
eukprot:evm.model.scf_392.5 EVM.evm.TU.scf_392.5   scf_392:20604-21218(-)